MKFVDAEWTEDAGVFAIKATGDDGSTWYVPSIDSDVPPWPEFLEEGGEVRGVPPPAPEPKAGQ